MKILKRLFLMVIIAVVFLGTAFFLIPRENMTFVVLDDGFTLYELSDDLVAMPLLKTDTTIVYEDGFAACFEYQDAGQWNWSLVTVEVSTGQKRCIENGQNGRYRIYDYNFHISDGKVYYPVHVVEDHQIVDTYVVEAKMDGSGGGIFQNLKINGFGRFQVGDGRLYYIEEETALPVVYDMETGVEEYLSEKRAALPYGSNYLDDGRFWYMTAEGDMEAYFRGENVDIEFFITGISSKDGSIIEVPYDYSSAWDANYWINDGYLYTFRNWRREEYKVADLYRTNLRTMREECIAEAVPGDVDFPAEITFGRKGLVISGSSLRIADYEWEDFIFYIPYDGSSVKEIIFAE